MRHVESAPYPAVEMNILIYLLFLPRIEDLCTKPLSFSDHKGTTDLAGVHNHIR